MAETKEIGTITNVTVTGDVLDIFTYYDTSFTEFLQFFIVNILGIVGTIPFKEGELGYTVEGKPNFSANVNDQGELVLSDDDTDPYFIDNDGYLIDGDSLPAPVADIATNVVGSGFKAHWEDVAGRTGFRLDVSTNPQFSSYIPGYQNLDVGAVLDCDITNLLAGTKYYYRVRTYDGIQTSLDSNIVSTLTLSDALYDLDGNLYHVINIGSKQLLVENLKVTKFADGSSIPNLTADTGPNLLTTWTNIDFGTFTSSGALVTSAIKAAGSYGHAKGNDILLQDGDTISFTINLILLSGDLPSVVLYKNGNVISTTPLTQGTNVVTYIVNGTAYYAMGFLSPNTGTNFSTASCKMSTIFNGGWQEDTYGAYCWYNNDIANKTLYGAQYNKYAVDNVKGLVYFERGGVQESGWRVMSTLDATNLMTELGGESIAGGKLKEVGTAHWDSPNVGATDDYGFKALPSGLREPGFFAFLGSSFYIWLSDNYDDNNGKYAVIYNYEIVFSVGLDVKNTGMAVRCIRDL